MDALMHFYESSLLFASVVIFSLPRISLLCFRCLGSLVTVRSEVCPVALKALMIRMSDASLSFLVLFITYF